MLGWGAATVTVDARDVPAPSEVGSSRGLDEGGKAWGRKRPDGQTVGLATGNAAEVRISAAEAADDQARLVG